MSNLPQITPTAIIVPNNNQQPPIPPYAQFPLPNNSVYGVQPTQANGVDLMTHLQLNLKAGINLEWCTRTMLHFSLSGPYLLKHQWVLDYLLDDFYNNFSKTSALSLRNLSQDGDFTQMLALHPKTKQYIYEVLRHFEDEYNDHIAAVGATAAERAKYANLDNELLMYTVDIVESVSSYIAPAPKDDEIFLCLTRIFEYQNDRSLVISIMRSFARFLVRSELTVESCANNLTPSILDKIASFLLTNDYDLILTSLDFFYQFSLPGNLRIDTLLKTTTRQEILRLKLPDLLVYQLNTTGNPNDFSNLSQLRLIKRTKPPIPTSPPTLAPNHYKDVISLNEPERATSWMRSCYKAVQDGEVTQISLWKAYEKQFEKESVQNKKKLLPAVDFIKNVSNAFPNSNAMVINLPNGQRKFIIKGIEPRFNSVDISTGDYEAFNLIVEKDPIPADVGNLQSKQEPLPVYNAPRALNDVNQSSSMLLTSLTNHPVGQELFKPVEERIFKKIEAAPVLFDELADSLKYLQ